MKKKVKILIGLSTALILLLIGTFVISYVALKSYLPNYEGELTLHGLTSEVNIYRDSTGVPYISAINNEDAAFALGFVHAQERMFQMDLFRRAAFGKLSEIVGNKTLKIDKMFRTLGIGKASIKNYSELDETTKKLLTAYSQGVNAYLHSRKFHSVEFDLLGYTPEDWKPQESVAIAKLLAWELNMAWWSKIIKAHLLQKIPAKNVNEIWPADNPNYPATISGLTNNLQLPEEFLTANAQAKRILGFEGSHIGSNNWAVSGKLSVNGKPIIANDTHLAFSLPDEWFVAVIKTKDLTVSGFTLPGVPGVLIGENGNIAWTETNLMSDEALFYYEKISRDGKKYFNNGAWKNLKIEQDTIHVKDSADVVIDIRSTKNGTIISDVHPYTILFPYSLQSKILLSMRWPALNSAFEIKAILDLNSAKNWDEFLEALKPYGYPGQNFIYADSSGNIGYLCAGKLFKLNTTEGERILNGQTAGTNPGFVPFEKMPKIFSPREGFLATANNKVIKKFPYHIADLWEPPARIERIVSLLKSKKKFSVKDFQKMQGDIYSDYPKKVVPLLLNAFGRAKIKDRNLKLSLKLLRNWNYKFSRYSQPAGIYSVFFQKLLENTFKDELGENLFKEFVFVADVPFRAIKKIIGRKYSYWWDDKTTRAFENRDDVLRKSLVNALSFLENKFGKNPAGWQWGRLHRLTLKHPFHGRSKLVDKIFDVGPFETGGCGTTLFNTEFSFVKPFDVTLGQAMRFIYDFAEPNVFYFTLPSGESGHVLSPHYGETTTNWLEGKYYKVYTDFSKLGNVPVLKLLPAD